MAAYRRVLPISSSEFAKELKKCVPPLGWFKSVAVANSGGPDSTCLLYLLHEYFKAQPPESNPPEVISLTVDHDLQARSASMASHCQRFAESLGVKHITSKVHWGSGGIPSRPQEGESFEGIARTVRYHTLLKDMIQTDSRVLALGHHADDQVETCMLRLSKGSSEIGAAGMTELRLWGMGELKDSSPLSWYGLEGMRRWIMRPLLPFSKDSILATCENRQLEFVQDYTNFQPELTLRNAIRKKLSADGALDETQLPPHVQEGMTNIRKFLPNIKSVEIDLEANSELLRKSVQVLGQRVSDFEDEVDTFLKRHRQASPPGSILIPSRALNTVKDPDIRTLLLYRILRYVSPHPWGSIRATAGRRKRKLDEIIKNVFVQDPFINGPTMFSSGGGVNWRAVIRRDDGSIRMPKKLAHAIGTYREAAWIVFRQEPQMGTIGWSRTCVDVTDQLLLAIQANDETRNILWDCRFVIRFDLKKIPEKLKMDILSDKVRIKVEPKTMWSTPAILLLSKNEDLSLIHSKILSQDPAFELINPHSNMDGWKRYWGWDSRVMGDTNTEVDIESDWIAVWWFRPITTA